MALFRLYVDEVGNHDLNSAENPNERFLSLTGVIFESNYYATILKPSMDKLKTDYFSADPDEPVIFHRKDMLNKRSPFEALRNPAIERDFNSRLLHLLDEWEYYVITVVIDKLAHKEQYHVWHYHPYHYCLKVLIERFILFLRNGNRQGDVMIESRGKVEDSKLMDSYQRLYLGGTENIAAELFQQKLTSKNLKIKPKKANISGLQLSDLIAHPSRREILLENGLIDDDRLTFGDQICEILRRSKYLRHKKTGLQKGYGKKLLP
jgi:hypothetical protein